MQIIEFCGSPGCGKSTLCDLLEQRLKAEHYCTINLQKKEKARSLLQKIKKVGNIYLFPFVYCHAFCNRKLRKCLNSLQIKEDDRHNTKRWNKRILEMNYLINKAKRKKYDYILLDEGFIQFFTSLMDNNVVNEQYSSVIEFYINEIYQYDYIIFYCSLPIDENIMRLKKRNRVNDRFVVDDEELMRDKLRWKINNIKALISFFPKGKVNIIDMENENLALSNVLKIIHPGNKNEK